MTDTLPFSKNSFSGPILLDKPCLNQNLDSVEEEITDFYHFCIVTRAMEKAVKDFIQNDVHVDEVNLTCAIPKFLKMKN